MDKTEKLKQDSILKLMLMMGLPTMGAQIVNLLYNIVDRIYIGHIEGIGGNALTGVGLCSSLIMIISAFAAFVGNGGAPLASIALGKGDNLRAKKILANGFTFLIAISIVLSVIFYIIKVPYLKLVGGSENTIPYALQYLDIYLIGTLFVLISLGLNNYLTAQGKSVLAMCSIIIGAVINLALDPLFIYAFDMGVRGAAIATVISQGVSATWILLLLFSKKRTLKIEIPLMKPDFKILRDIFTLGISPFVMSITESLITLTMSGQLQRYGDDNYVGSLTILQSVMQLMSTPLSGFTQGITSLIAFNYGAKENRRVKEIYKYTFIILFTYTFLFSVCTIIFPGAFARIFTDEQSIIVIAKKYMPVFMAGMTIFGIQRACQTTFVALGDAKISLFIALLRKVILLIPFAFLLPLMCGIIGVYLAEALADGIAALLCGTIFIFRFPKLLKKNIEITEA